VLRSPPLDSQAGTPPRFEPPLVYRPPTIGILTAGIGLFVFLLGTLSALYPEPLIYRDVLAGYDPPFDAVAGTLLAALAFRIRERSPVAWLFSLLAPALTVFIALLSPNLYSILAAGATTMLVAVIYPYRAGFYRGSATGPEATQLLVLVAALVSILSGMVGSRWLASQFAPKIGGWADSLYFTVSTISTNGSNFTPMTDAARLFTVALILLGVGTFLSAVVVLFLPFLERRLERIAARLERAQMEDLNQHVIICGATAEARATAESLRDQGIRSVLLSDDARLVDHLKTEGFRTRLGEPSSEEELRAVGIERARALVVAQASDAESLLTVITARGMVPGLRIVAIAAGPHSLAKLERAGANEAISLVAVAARLVSAAALGQSVANSNNPKSAPRARP
jgi:voltage-gated potassium channel